LVYGGAVSLFSIMLYEMTSKHVINYISKYAEKVSISETMLMHLPEELSFEEGAGIPEVS
jgi:NADPH:quinone reductase-like Zn-dependent oxidoreductase